MSGKFQGRTAEPKDAAKYVEWLKAASDKNLFEPEVYDEPTCNTITIEKDGEPVLMNSFRLVLVQEALAPKPGISPMDEARALKELFDGIKRVARATGIREINFQCIDPTLEKFILRHGFTKSEVPVYKFKVGAEEQPKVEEKKCE
jgi:hypothetical protein